MNPRVPTRVPAPLVIEGEIIVEGGLEQGPAVWDGDALWLRTGDQLALVAYRRETHLFVTVLRELVVGMAATYSVGADDYPATVREFSESGHRVTVTLDRQRGPLFVPQDGDHRVFTRRGTGEYRQQGRNHGYLTFGIRESHRDPSF